MDIVRNPVFIAVICGGLSYLYLRWKTNKLNKKRKNKKMKEVNLAIPLIVMIITWFLVYGYNQYNNNNINNNNSSSSSRSNPVLPLPVNTNFKFKSGSSSSSEPKSFNVLEGGAINIPSNTNKLPNVMLDLF
jgi:hypothetical protein